RTSRANDADELAGLDFERHIAQNREVRFVSEGDVLELNGACKRTWIDGVRFFRNNRVSIQNGAHSFHTHCRLRDLIGHSRKIFDWFEEAAEIGKEDSKR